jgi:hypothetical protein
MFVQVYVLTILIYHLDVRRGIIFWTGRESFGILHFGSEYNLQGFNALMIFLFREKPLSTFL